MTLHAFLPTTIVSDKVSAFVSQLIKETADVLGITLELSTTKRAQMIGMLERTHASLKTALNIKTRERFSMWYRDVIITPKLPDVLPHKLWVRT